MSYDIKLPKGTVIKNGWLVKWEDSWVKVTQHKCLRDSDTGFRYQFVPHPKPKSPWDIETIVYTEEAEWTVNSHDAQGARIQIGEADVEKEPLVGYLPEGTRLENGMVIRNGSEWATVVDHDPYEVGTFTALYSDGRRIRTQYWPDRDSWVVKLLSGSEKSAQELKISTALKQIELARETIQRHQSLAGEDEVFESYFRSIVMENIENILKT